MVKSKIRPKYKGKTATEWARYFGWNTGYINAKIRG